MHKLFLMIFSISSWFSLSPGFAASSLQQQAVVRAILFYSPTCPHCHKVISEDLPPLFEKYGDQFQIVGVDTYTSGGQALFQAAITRFNIPEERQAVPTLIIGDLVLVGSLEIPQQLPDLVETYLAQGGIDWPDIPGLAEALQAAETQQAAEPQSDGTPLPGTAQESPPTDPDLTQPAGAVSAPEPTTAAGLIIAEESDTSIAARLTRDPAGNFLAIVVLVGMLASLGAVMVFLLSRGGEEYPLKPSLAIPALSLLGLAIAVYMAYVETAHVTAVCGPVGDCNTVQQSEYARLFGVLPIGGLGIAGYIAILLAWIASQWGSGRSASFASLALFGMTLFGTLFSVYLTFLEPFVIGATCAWCLSSAVIMTALLWMSIAAGKHALLTLWYGDASLHAHHGRKRAVIDR